MAKIMAENMVDALGILYRVSCDSDGWIYLYGCQSKVKNRFIFLSKLRVNNGEPDKMKKLIRDIKRPSNQGPVFALILQLLKECDKKKKELEEALKESKDISG